MLPSRNAHRQQRAATHRIRNESLTLFRICGILLIMRERELTTQQRAAILDYIRQGLPAWRAAAEAGIPKSTWFDMVKKAEQGKAPFAEFAAEIEAVQQGLRARWQLEQEREEAQRRILQIALGGIALSQRERDLAEQLLREMSSAGHSPSAKEVERRWDERGEANA